MTGKSVAERDIFTVILSESPREVLLHSFYGRQAYESASQEVLVRNRAFKRPSYITRYIQRLETINLTEFLQRLESCYLSAHHVSETSLETEIQLTYREQPLAISAALQFRSAETHISLGDIFLLSKPHLQCYPSLQYPPKFQVLLSLSYFSCWNHFQVHVSLEWDQRDRPSVEGDLGTQGTIGEGRTCQNRRRQ